MADAVTAPALAMVEFAIWASTSASMRFSVVVPAPATATPAMPPAIATDAANAAALMVALSLASALTAPVPALSDFRSAI